jgi:hypothetical protein
MGDRADVPDRRLLTGGIFAAGAGISGTLFRNGLLGQACTPSRVGEATLPQAKTGLVPSA